MMVLTWAVFGLLACDDAGSDIPDGALDRSNCGPSLPTFEAVAVVEGPVFDFGEGPQRSLQVSALASDLDGDLHIYRAAVWVDDRPDGEFEGDPVIDVLNEDFPERFCDVDFVTAGALVPLGGDDVPLDTTLDFGLVIYDAAGHASNDANPVGVAFRTPP